jgi:hypothetical protein
VSVPLTAAGPAGAVVTPLGVSQFSVNGSLSAISALTPTDAWAVGQTASQRPLIAHWNGKSWKQVPSPDLPGYGLSGVAAISATDAWCPWP